MDASAPFRGSGASFYEENKGTIFMKNIFKAAAVASLLTLAACGGSGDDAAGDNVADQADNTADVMEDMADNTSNEAASDALEDNASAIRENGQEQEEAIDDADGANTQ
jgi:predicted small lipoprotein YifL